MAAARLRVASWNIRAAIGPGPFPDRWWSQHRCRSPPGDRHLPVRPRGRRDRAPGGRRSSRATAMLRRQRGGARTRARDGRPVRRRAHLRGASRPMTFVGAGLYRQRAAVADADRRRPLRRAAGRADGRLRRAGGRGSPRRRRPLCRCTRPHPRAALPPARDRRWLARRARRTSATSAPASAGSRPQATAAAFGDTAPALLLGDLNAPIEAPELRPLAGWTDGFAEAAGDPARISTDDGHAIDHVLGRGVAFVRAASLREAGELSDHYPIVAEVAGTGLRHSSYAAARSTSR